MEGRLIKRDNDFYSLVVDGLVMATSNGMIVDYKLSLKNCQAIENGYGLDELAREACDITDPLRLDSQKYKQDPYFKIGFNKGFQKALEILGDKEFSKDDVEFIFESGRNYQRTGYMNVHFNNVIQSLQQTEFDVEIEMEDTFIKNSDQYIDEVGVGNYSTHTKKPKLDADGCLILRRK